MIFGVKALISGDFILKEPIYTYTKGFKVSIYFEDGNYKISLIKPIPENSPLQIRYQINENYKVPVAPEESAYEEYIKLLQDIEALGGFHYGIIKIFYRETLELCWYKGQDLFQELHEVCSLKKQYNSPKKHILSQSNLSSIVLLNKQIPNAKVPYTYFREANGFLQNQEYRLSYLHFFMLLEFCFSTHTKEKEVIRDFSGSIGLNLAILSTLKTMQESYKELFEWIKDAVTKKYQSYSLRTLYKLLFYYRGLLAHGSKRSSPFLLDEKELRPITLFISLICFMVCGNMQVYCMSSEEDNKKRIQERIDSLKNELNIS